MRQFLKINAAFLTVIFCCPPLLAGDWQKPNWSYMDKHRNMTIQTPGAVLPPKGPWQKVGDIQIPKGISAISVRKEPCKHHVSICSDTLFEFDKSTLTPDAEAALKLAAAKVQALGLHPISIEGHTDAKGDDEYNQKLSEKRAERVKNWLLENHVVDPRAKVVGFGKKQPVAPNTNSDGTDNPKGRQRNRRVEIVVDTCTTLQSSAADTTSSTKAQ
jgi:outer membrane protein OmpA-like peptidoglycan-associated protein